jgi:hypothetical protein
MLFPLNKTKYLESSQGSTRRLGSSLHSDLRAHCAGAGTAPNRGVIAATRRQGLKRFHQARDRRVSASGSRERPRSPHANRVADKVAVSAKG